MRDHCHITGKYSSTAHRDCNINIKLNHKILLYFKFNSKIKLILNRLGERMSFNVNNNLIFIDSFQFLSSSLDSLVKDLDQDDFKFLSQEFDR